jgi:hypothetical protein
MNRHSVSSLSAIEAVIHIKALARRYTFLGVAGLALAIIGLMALWFPVYLNQYDAYGVKVSCGNGFSSNLNQAAQANLVTNCDTALLVRRAWAIPAVAIGWLLVTGFLLAWVHREPKEEASSA